MSNPTIGIKIANGAYFPVLDATQVGSRKRLVLTPARDQQDAVEVDLYRSEDSEGAGSIYVGSLVVENIESSPESHPEIALVVGIDGAGNLNATVRDAITGEYQSLSVSLLYLDEMQTRAEVEDEVGQDAGFDVEEELDGNLFIHEVPELDDEILDETGDGPAEAGAPTPEQWPTAVHEGALSPQYGESGPGATRSRMNPVLFLGYMILSLAILGIILFLVFRAIRSGGVPALHAGTFHAAGHPLSATDVRGIISLVSHLV